MKQVELVAEMKDRLKEAMELRGKEQVDLSKDLNIPKSAISQYLSGESKKMDSRRLFAIGAYLNVDESWLLGMDEPMERKVSATFSKEMSFDKVRTLATLEADMTNDEQIMGMVKKFLCLKENDKKAVTQLIEHFLSNYENYSE